MYLHSTRGEPSNTCAWTCQQQGLLVVPDYINEVVSDPGRHCGKPRHEHHVHTVFGFDAGFAHVLLVRMCRGVERKHQMVVVDGHATSTIRNCHG